MRCSPVSKNATLPETFPEPRLAAHIRVAAMVRLCAEAGEFAAVIKKGDATSGAIIVQGREKGRFCGLFERLSGLESGPNWQPIGPQDIDNDMEIEEYLKRRQMRDPDLWIVELDIASKQRLAGLLAAAG